MATQAVDYKNIKTPMLLPNYCHSAI